MTRSSSIPARALKVPIDGLDDVDWIDNKGLLELTDVPEHLVIVGGSYIGLEFGQIFRRFGSQVTIIEVADQLLPREDSDIAGEAKDILTGEGITVATGATIESVSQPGKNQVEVTFRDGDGSKTITGSHLLLAAGRVPNSDTLALDAAGVEADDRGYITVDGTTKTNVCLLYTSPSPRDATLSRMPSSA